MPITLEQAKVGMADKVDQAVVDEFRRGSFILDMLTFDNAVSSGTGGSTMVYGYLKLKTPSLASGRAINSEYVAGEAIKEEATSRVKIMGGAFEVDRVLEKTSAKSELAFQTKEKVKATINYFQNLFINGDSTAEDDNNRNLEQFDGLDKLITDSSTEIVPATAIDLSDAEKIKANGPTLVQALHDMVAEMEDKPDALFMNGRMKAILQTIGYNMGYYSREEDAFGRMMDVFDGIPMIDMKKYFNGTNSIDVVETDENGITSIYGAKFGLNGLHGISPVGNKVVSSYMPKLDEPGAVKKGEVELLAGIVLKNSLMAGAVRNIKIGVVTPSR